LSLCHGRCSYWRCWEEIASRAIDRYPRKQMEMHVIGRTLAIDYVIAGSIHMRYREL
jgi:hypothetical protein